MKIPAAEIGYVKMDMERWADYFEKQIKEGKMQPPQYPWLEYSCMSSRDFPWHWLRGHTDWYVGGTIEGALKSNSPEAIILTKERKLIWQQPIKGETERRWHEISPEIDYNIEE